MRARNGLTRWSRQPHRLRGMNRILAQVTSNSAIGMILTSFACVFAASAFAEGQHYAIAEPAMRPIALTGFTRARARLPLVAEMAGRIESVGYDIGDAIGNEAVFARIDDTFVRLELEQNKVQQARLTSQIAYDEREVKRYEQLARQNNAAASQLDTFRQTLTNNQNEFQRLAVEQTVLEERLARTKVAAPAGWKVTERSVEPGQWVNVGQHLGEVADFTTLTVPFALTPEQHLALTAMAKAPGGIRLSLPDVDADRSMAASLMRINPGFDPETRKIAVELKIDASLDAPRGGLRAELEIPIPERSGAILLPAAAVRQSYEEYWVDPVDSEPIRVLLLGRYKGPDGERLRVSSPDVNPGDRFLTADTQNSEQIDSTLDSE